MIDLVGLTKRFDGFTAVDGVNLCVAAGEVLVLLGPNGAGKTTTVRMLAAILQPTEGHAVVAGFDTRRDPIAVRHRVGILTEQPGLYLRMRGGEYLSFFGSLYGLAPKVREERARRWLDHFDMPEAWDRRGRNPRADLYLRPMAVWGLYLALTGGPAGPAARLEALPPREPGASCPLRRMPEGRRRG